MAKKKTTAELLKENLKKTNLLLSKVENLEKEFKKAQIINFIRFIVVFIPILLAFLYLIPIFQTILDLYHPLVDFIIEIQELYKIT